MKTLGALPLLAAVGHAQTVTITSTDYFGKTIASSTATYTPGEDFNVMLDLSINSWSLKELKLNTGAYGVNKCTFMLNDGYDYKPVGWFDDMCEWPNFVSTDLYLNVENIPQLMDQCKISIKCETQDVAWKTASKDFPCAGGLALTPQNNQLANPYTNFDFEVLYESPYTWKWDTGLIYFSNFADIFLRGFNPVLDLLFIGINNAVYQYSFERILMAYGYMSGGEHTEAIKDPWMEEDIHWMIEDFEQTGFWTYGVETAAAAYKIYENFNDLEWEAFNEYLFNFADFEETQFGMVVNGDLTFDDEFYKSLNWYYRLQVFAQETMTMIYIAHYEPYAISQWVPRNIRATWELFLAFFE